MNYSLAFLDDKDSVAWRGAAEFQSDVRAVVEAAKRLRERSNYAAVEIGLPGRLVKRLTRLDVLQR